MLEGTVYIRKTTETTRRYEKAMEGERTGEKVMEPYGSL